jgi:hypothetical protein
MHSTNILSIHPRHCIIVEQFLHSALIVAQAVGLTSPSKPGKGTFIIAEPVVPAVGVEVSAPVVQVTVSGSEAEASKAIIKMQLPNKIKNLNFI